jgi:hypothetical protein
MMELMIQNGADLSLSSEVWDNHKCGRSTPWTWRSDGRTNGWRTCCGAPARQRDSGAGNRFGFAPPAINQPSGNNRQSKAGVDASVDPHCSLNALAAWVRRAVFGQ